jgi:hypothetical protein
MTGSVYCEPPPGVQDSGHDHNRTLNSTDDPTRPSLTALPAPPGSAAHNRAAGPRGKTER